MDSSNFETAQTSAQLPAAGGDWRSQLLPESRERIINKITETLPRLVPYSGEEGLQEFKQFATRYEAKIFDVATSQSEYLRKISLKLLTLVTRSENTLHHSGSVADCL